MQFKIFEITAVKNRVNEARLKIERLMMIFLLSARQQGGRITWPFACGHI